MAITAPNSTLPTGPKRSIPDDAHRHIIAGFVVMTFLIAGIGIWATQTSLAGAVIGAGTVVVDSNVKKVQHPTGGIVGEIKVHDGMRVEEGDLLIRLDETVTRANLGIIMSQLDELAARQSRLIAERDGASALAITDSLAARSSLPEVARLIASEATLMESRRLGREGQRSQLEERLNQLARETEGLEIQSQSKARELEFIRIELGEIEKLWQKNLAPLSKKIQLSRDETRIDGERGQLIASIAQTRAKLAETRLQMLQIDSDLRTEVTKDLREAQAKLAELAERRIAAEDQLKRIDLRAPQSGIVHQLSVFTVGGVISPGEQIMLIVPQDEALVLDVKISPQDISEVHVGQEAFVRLTSLNARTTPELRGEVTRVSADVEKDRQTGAIYFVARVTLPSAELARLGKYKLVPGMPAEVHIQTEQRTVLSYILKPLADQIARAFKER